LPQEGNGSFNIRKYAHEVLQAMDLAVKRISSSTQRIVNGAIRATMQPPVPHGV
jgi:hypothetical protein